MSQQYYSLRCTACDQNWPLTSSYATCPVCKAETWRSEMFAMSVQEATGAVAQHVVKMKRYADFEEFYVRREMEKAGDCVPDEWVAQ
jgi:hypothetical protein